MGITGYALFSLLCCHYFHYYAVKGIRHGWFIHFHSTMASDVSGRRHAKLGSNCKDWDPFLHGHIIAESLVVSTSPQKWAGKRGMHVDPHLPIVRNIDDIRFMDVSILYAYYAAYHWIWSPGLAPTLFSRVRACTCMLLVVFSFSFFGLVVLFFLFGLRGLVWGWLTISWVFMVLFDLMDRQTMRGL